MLTSEDPGTVASTIANSEHVASSEVLHPLTGTIGSASVASKSMRVKGRNSQVKVAEEPSTFRGFKVLSSVRALSRVLPFVEAYDSNQL